MKSMKNLRKPLAGLILLAAGALLLAACGGGGVESDEVAAVVEQSVAAAVAAAIPAAPTGATAEEISAMVQQAVESAAPEGVTAADIGTMVEAAVAAAAEPAVSAAQIESLVTQAVEAAAAEAATPLSASEIQAIVAAAVAAMPEPEPMVVAMPTAAPAMEMEVVVVGGTHRTTHENWWAGMEQLDPASPLLWPPPIFVLWDHLVVKNLDTGVPGPGLATSWEANEDATRWTFDLRQGVTHSDGTPLTAADVVYSTQRHLDPNIGSGLRAELGIIDPEMFETPDNNTVVFNLNSGHVDFPLQLSNDHFRIVPDGSGDSIRETGIGTGPFTLESADPDGISVFNARDDYWGGTPLLGKITVVSIGDGDARINAALAGQTDLVGQITSITASQASLFEGDPDFYIQENSRGQIQILAMIVTESPFDDVRVRQALKMVVDPEEMIAVIAQGHGVPSCNNPAGPSDQYYLPLECLQDIEGARALLAEAGYPDGLTIELETSNLNPMFIPLATVYREQAAEAGITVNINQVPADGYWGSTWLVHPFSSSYYNDKPIDSFISQTLLCGGSWNETFWCNEQHDALQDAARAELDFNARKALYQQAQQLIADDGGMISPFFANFIRAINVRLQGVPVRAKYGEFPYHEFRIVEP